MGDGLVFWILWGPTALTLLKVAGLELTMRIAARSATATRLRCLWMRYVFLRRYEVMIIEFWSLALDC